MLAVSDQDYYLPVHVEQADGSTQWVLRHKQSGDLIVSQHFTYTVIDHLDRAAKDNRLSFEYQGKSVKPTPRTLRRFGSTNCGSFTQVLANLSKERSSLTFHGNNVTLTQN